MSSFEPFSDAEEIEEEVEQEKASASETKTLLARKILQRLREEIDSLERLLAREAEWSNPEEMMHTQEETEEIAFPGTDSHVIEGVFDGLQMIGSNGRQYHVPPNYASKSKLVEGDILKLTIQPNGSFLYKQIGPIERQRIVGMLIKEELSNEWRVMANGRKYHVLPSAISYYKGDVGDDVVILIPLSEPSKWAAVENIIKAG